MKCHICNENGHKSYQCKKVKCTNVTNWGTSGGIVQKAVATEKLHSGLKKKAEHQKIIQVTQIVTTTSVLR